MWFVGLIAHVTVYSDVSNYTNHLCIFPVLVGYHLSIRDSNSYFENFYFTGSYCWRRIGCGDVQQGHAAPSLQHQDKEHGRCLEQILGWNLPVVYICDKARGPIVFAKEVECRR